MSPDEIGTTRYGNGVYFAKQGEVSMHHYAQASHTSWKNAGFSVSKLAAVCEIVNLPAEFVYVSPPPLCRQL
jgi:ubiquitin-conjugating enzyme E2 Q